MFHRVGYSSQDFGLFDLYPGTFFLHTLEREHGVCSLLSVIILECTNLLKCALNHKISGSMAWNLFPYSIADLGIQFQLVCVNNVT